MKTIITDSGFTATVSTDGATDIEVRTEQRKQGLVMVISEFDRERTTLSAPVAERSYRLAEGRPSATVARMWFSRLCIHSRNLISLFSQGKYGEIERYINYIKI